MYHITGVPAGYRALSGQPGKDERKPRGSRPRKQAGPFRGDDVQISDVAYQLAREVKPPGEEPEG